MPQRTQPARAPSPDPLTGSPAPTNAHVGGRTLPSHSPLAKILDAAGAALAADAAPHRSPTDAVPVRGSMDAVSVRGSMDTTSPGGSMGAVRPFDPGRPFPPPLRPMKNPGLDRKQLLDLYYYMRLNRSLEERLVNLYRQGRIAGGL